VTSLPWRSRIVGQGNEDPTGLLANPANWRTHPPAQRDALRGSLDTVGWVAQVMINRVTGHVVDGHARVEEAIRRGEPTVPVLYVELEPDEERLVLATLDPIGAMAEQATERLEELLGEISVDDEGLLRLLKELAPPKRGLTEPDAVPEVPTSSWVKPGDLFVLGDHRLLCGDATNPDDVARLLDGAAPTLLATDPPYGVRLDPTWRDGLYNGLGPAERPYMRSDGQAGGNGATGAKQGAHRRTQGHRNTTLSGDVRADWSAAYELVPSLQVGYVWHAGVHAATVAAGLERIGFEIASQVIWDKGLFAMSRGWYHWGHEPCWVIRKQGAVVRFLGERNQSTIWRAPSPKMIMAGSKEAKFDHPAQKPVLLFEIPMRNHGGDVYDPFLGSGTALIAAETLGRRCYAMEVEPRYVQVALERWEGFTGNKATRVDG
jgi:DNA modification methylase